MRTSSIAILLCLVAAATCQTHDLVIGQATYGDALIYKTDEVKFGFPFFVRTSIIEFPEPGYNNYAIIKAIYVKDNTHDGSGGWPSISAGGVGQRFVKLKLKTQRGCGHNFTISIYGRYV